MRWLTIPLALLFLSGASCAKTESEAKPQTLRSTCTTGMVADLVRQVGGNRVEVTALMGAGVDPHLYVATRNDIASLLTSDAVFYNGLHLEGRMADALSRISQQRTVQAVADAIPHESLLLPDAPGHPDPHVWMDVTLWTRCAGQVTETLAQLDPAGQENYRANLASYRARLERLDDYVRQTLASVEPRRRVLVTAHDAFHYLGRRYGLEVRGVQGISTESEAGIADINALVDLLCTRNIPAVFVETSVSDKNIRALQEGCEARGHSVTLGGRLFSDAMGPPGTYEGTYVGMIDHNVTTIARALGATVDPDGMQGRLARGH